MRRAASHETVRVLSLDTVDSTNRIVLEQAAQGEPAGLVVVARHQTAGKGRQGRAWFAEPESSLTFSVLTRPTLAPDLMPLMPLVAGLAIRDVLHRRLPDLWLKWPNDLYVDGRKLGGILCEMDSSLNGHSALIIGIGINLAPPAKGWSDELSGHASSIEECMNDDLPPIQPAEVAGWVEQIATRIVEREAHLSCDGPRETLDDYRDAARPLIGRTVRIDQQGELRSAKVIGISDNGGLQVLQEGAEAFTLLAGDVHLRAL